MLVTKAPDQLNQEIEKFREMLSSLAQEKGKIVGSISDGQSSGSDASYVENDPPFDDTIDLLRKTEKGFDVLVNIATLTKGAEVLSFARKLDEQGTNTNIQDSNGRAPSVNDVRWFIQKWAKLEGAVESVSRMSRFVDFLEASESSQKPPYGWPSSAVNSSQSHNSDEQISSLAHPATEVRRRVRPDQ